MARKRKARELHDLEGFSPPKKQTYGSSRSNGSAAITASSILSTVPPHLSPDPTSAKSTEHLLLDHDLGSDSTQMAMEIDISSSFFNSHISAENAAASSSTPVQPLEKPQLVNPKRKLQEPQSTNVHRRNLTNIVESPLPFDPFPTTASSELGEQNNDNDSNVSKSFPSTHERTPTSRIIAISLDATSKTGSRQTVSLATYSDTIKAQSSNECGINESFIEPTSMHYPVPIAPKRSSLYPDDVELLPIVEGDFSADCSRFRTKKGRYVRKHPSTHYTTYVCSACETAKSTLKRNEIFVSSFPVLLYKLHGSSEIHGNDSGPHLCNLPVTDILAAPQTLNRRSMSVKIPHLDIDDVKLLPVVKGDFNVDGTHFHTRYYNYRKHHVSTNYTTFGCMTCNNVRKHYSGGKRYMPCFPVLLYKLHDSSELYGNDRGPHLCYFHLTSTMESHLTYAYDHYGVSDAENMDEPNTSASSPNLTVEPNQSNNFNANGTSDSYNAEDFVQPNDFSATFPSDEADNGIELAEYGVNQASKINSLIIDGCEFVLYNTTAYKTTYVCRLCNLISKKYNLSSKPGFIKLVKGKLYGNFSEPDGKKHICDFSLDVFQQEYDDVLFDPRNDYPITIEQFNELTAPGNIYNELGIVADDLFDEYYPPNERDVHEAYIGFRRRDGSLKDRLLSLAWFGQSRKINERGEQHTRKYPMKTEYDTHGELHFAPLFPRKKPYQACRNIEAVFLTLCAMGKLFFKFEHLKNTTLEEISDPDLLKWTLNINNEWEDKHELLVKAFKQMVHASLRMEESSLLSKSNKMEPIFNCTFFIFLFLSL